MREALDSNYFSEPTQFIEIQFKIVIRDIFPKCNTDNSTIQSVGIKYITYFIIILLTQCQCNCY